MSKTKKSFVTGAAILGAAGLIVKIIGAIFRIPLSNIVGTVGMSYYEVAYPYYTWLLVISSAGLPTAISKLVSERIALGDAKGARKIFHSAMKLLVVIGIITSILLFAASSGLAKLSGAAPARFSFMALAPALLFVSIMCAYRGYLQGMQCMTGTALSQIVEQLVKLIAGLALAYYFIRKHPQQPEYAAMGALIGVSISELVALISIKFYYGNRLKHKALAICELTAPVDSVKPISGRTAVKRLLAIAIPITIGASIMPITGIADSLFIIKPLIAKTQKFFASSAEIFGSMPISLATPAIKAVLDASGAIAEQSASTSYTILRTYVTTLINMPAVLTLSLSMSLVPAVSDAMTRRQTRTVHAAVRTGMKFAIFIGAPCAVGLFVLGGPIMSMLYKSVRSSSAIFDQAQSIMYVASIGVLFLSLVQTLTGIIQGMGKPRVPVYFLAAGGAVKIISMLLFMNYTDLGILGAALSTVLCYAVAGIGDTVYVIRKSRMKVNYADTFVKPIISSIVLGAAVWAVYGIAAKSGHLTVATILSVLVGIVVYFVMMLILHPISVSDLEFIPKGDKLKKILKIK